MTSRAGGHETMEPNRWYHLRHPEGFSDDLFRCFSASCRIWIAHIESIIAGWEHLDPVRALPRPRYWFGEAARTDDTSVVLPIGGEAAYGVLKLFEDSPPRTLFEYFPLWFQLDLEWGRRDTLGWFPELAWTRVMAESDVALLRGHPPFTRGA